ncbi:MAG TPA: endonuclease/exonuclease/phosphatase family protein [Terriglobales bacterium]|nr:endonuclease/exonuclease/phosphatase family protein [Terriglobales bacterium]
MRAKNVWQAVISMQEIETGNFSPPRLVLIPPDSIRVVNWNINRGLRLQGVIEFLATAKADVVLLQESDLNARRTHHLNIAKEIAQKLHLNYVFGREFRELTQGSRASPAYHGQATLSRWPLSNSRILRFQRQSNFWRPRWFLPEIEPFQERIGGRLALVCETTIAGKKVVTYNVHLESKGDDALRCSQMEETLEDARRYEAGTPIVLAGDFNFDVSGGSASTAIRQAQFQDAFANQHVPTTPHSFLEPGRSIDWIFIRGPIHATSASVHSSISASDHYPLSVVLSLP